MSYVEVCQKHGQYHGEICGDCYEELKEKNARLRYALERIAEASMPHEEPVSLAIARAALEKLDESN